MTNINQSAQKKSAGAPEDMSPRQRVLLAMALGHPRRCPVMCQLSIGHYFLQSGVSPLDVWLRSDGFADALVRLQERYRFDGILVNLPGRDPSAEDHIARIEKSGEDTIVHWDNGSQTLFPPDDNPRVIHGPGVPGQPTFDQVDPEQLYYVDPWNLGGITYPFRWDLETEPRSPGDFFPDTHLDTIREVQARARNDVSIHAEVFSPHTQFLELLNYQEALIAPMMDREKVKACLARLTEGAIEWACKEAGTGVDAVLISSPFAGAGFISRDDYTDLVLPYERRLVAGVKEQYPDMTVYTHTCGAIGDRLDLMLETGTNGIDTLDPPPLGTIELPEAAAVLRGKAFIKGNLDPVNTLLKGDEEEVRAAAMKRLDVARDQGGFILSTACSVSPRTPPRNIELLAELADKYPV
jgi:hypothetical protein